MVLEGDAAAFWIECGRRDVAKAVLRIGPVPACKAQLSNQSQPTDRTATTVHHSGASTWPLGISQHPSLTFAHAFHNHTSVFLSALLVAYLHSVRLLWLHTCIQ